MTLEARIAESRSGSGGLPGLSRRLGLFLDRDSAKASQSAAAALLLRLV
jgi:hypothetical protein